MKFYIASLFLLPLSVLYSADLNLVGWTEEHVGGQVGELITKSYLKEQSVNVFEIKMHLTNTYSASRNIDNVIQSIEIKAISEVNSKFTEIARCATVDEGFWFFLHNDKFQVYAGVAGKNGHKFCKPGQKFVAVIPKVISEKIDDYWIVMFIADDHGVYHLYDKVDSDKYNSNGKK